jgi:hypothetical protein
VGGKEEAVLEEEVAERERRERAYVGRPQHELPPGALHW